MLRHKKPRNRKGGKWVFVDDTPEEAEERRRELVDGMIACQMALSPNMDARFKAAESYQNYFPGDNEVPEEGAWILVKTPPHCEYTVKPLSIWFAQPWPSNLQSVNDAHRVRIVTPRGDLGLFPQEYRIINDIQTYYQFIGEGMEIKFFGPVDGVPVNQLHYIMSRGISKTDAIAMLLGLIKGHGICWLEATKELTDEFGLEWANEDKLATK